MRIDQHVYKYCMSMSTSTIARLLQLQLSATLGQPATSLAAASPSLSWHSCNQSKRGHSQQRNMLKNKQHDAGICCRNAAAVAVIAAAAATAAAVGQSTTAIRNQSKCQRAKQTSRTHTHERICRSLCVCVHGHHTSNHVPKIFNLFSLKRFSVAASALCRPRSLWRSRSGFRLAVIAFAMANENKTLLVQHGVCTTRRTH